MSAKKKLGNCTVAGCGAKAVCKEMCDRHYRRVRQHGTPNLLSPPQPAPCQAKGCDRTGAIKGLCDLHYRRLRRLGTTALQTPAERFWNHIDRSAGPDSCWIWKDSTNSTGYGKYGTRAETGGEKPTEIAHRYAYQLTYGPIPDGLHCLHRCDNRRCCNPAHLWLGTNADNVADKMAKGRYRPLKGSLNPRALLTEEQVIEIRRLHSEAVLSRDQIAAQFGVTPNRIWQIVRRKQWKHI